MSTIIIVISITIIIIIITNIYFSFVTTIGFLVYPNLFGTKGFVVVVVVGTLLYRPEKIAVEENH